MGDLLVPDNKTPSKKSFTNIPKIKESLLNNILNPKKKEEIETFVPEMKNSVVSLGRIKIPCFEWKQDSFKCTKTVEHYLNIYYQKRNSSFIKNSSTNVIKSKLKDTTINADELPFNFKEHSLSAEDEEQITKILKKEIIFQDISQEILSIIECEMIRLELPEGKIVYDLNDEGHFFYIIAKGKVSFNIHNSIGNTQTQWYTFGEISLFTEKRREEIIITKEPTELYIIDGESFRDIQKRNNEMILKDRYNFLNNIFLFECLDKISKYNVAQKMKKKKFLPNTKIITQ